jgi:hypothetical protein
MLAKELVLGFEGWIHQRKTMKFDNSNSCPVRGVSPANKQVTHESNPVIGVGISDMCTNLGLARVVDVGCLTIFLPMLCTVYL